MTNGPGSNRISVDEFEDRNSRGDQETDVEDTAGPATAEPRRLPPTDEPARFPTSEPRIPEEESPAPGGEPQARPPTDEPARFPTSEPRVPDDETPAPGGEPQATPPTDEQPTFPLSRPGTERSDRRRAAGDTGERVRPDQQRVDREAEADQMREFVGLTASAGGGRGPRFDEESPGEVVVEVGDQPEDEESGVLDSPLGFAAAPAVSAVDRLSERVDSDVRESGRTALQLATPGVTAVDEVGVVSDRETLAAAAAVGVATPEPATTGTGVAVLAGLGAGAAIASQSEIEVPDETGFLGSEVEVSEPEVTEIEPTEPEVGRREVEVPSTGATRGEVEVPVEPDQETGVDVIRAQELLHGDLEGILRRERVREEEETVPIVPEEMIPDEEVIIGEEPPEEEAGEEEISPEETVPASEIVREEFEERQVDEEVERIEEADEQVQEVEFEEQFDTGAVFEAEVAAEDATPFVGAIEEELQVTETEVTAPEVDTFAPADTAVATEPVEVVMTDVVQEMGVAEPVEVALPEEVAFPDEPGFEFAHPNPGVTEAVEPAQGTADPPLNIGIPFPRADVDSDDRRQRGILDEVTEFEVRDIDEADAFIDDLEFEVGTEGLL